MMLHKISIHTDLLSRVPDKGKISFIVIFVFLVYSALGQSPLFQSYNLLKKNEPLGINKIIQDKTGFIWFGTDKGLFKFDGVNYKIIVNNSLDKNVTALAQDPIGRVWMGFTNGKIAIVDKNSVKFFDPAEGMPSVQSSDIRL